MRSTTPSSTARAVSSRRRRQLLHGAAALLGAAAAPLRAQAAPVLLGFDGELSVEGSTSAQAIQAGILIAIDEINAAGGVFDGRPLALVTRDNRTMPARSAQNLREFAAMPSLVGVFCGRYSPTVMETVPLFHELQLPLFDPWASADSIIDHGREPSYTFRLSMRDSWAMPLMAGHAARSGRTALGLFAVNTGWGRSAERALAEHLAARGGRQRLVGTRWYNYTDGPEVFRDKFLELRHAGAQALIFVGNFREGSELVHAVAALPAADRLPLLAHNGVMGGDFYGLCKDVLPRVDVGVVQTFGFRGSVRPRAAPVLKAAQARLGGAGVRLPSPSGLAQAYDLMHIVARAVTAARTTQRPAVRDAMERPGPYAGLMRDYAVPFTPTRHEALSPEDLYVARFDGEGSLVRVR